MSDATSSASVSACSASAPRRAADLGRRGLEPRRDLAQQLLDGAALLGHPFARRAGAARHHRFEGADLGGNAVGRGAGFAQQPVADAAEFLAGAVGSPLEGIDETRLQLAGAARDTVAAGAEGALDHGLDHRHLAGQTLGRGSQIAAGGFLDLGGVAADRRRQAFDRAGGRLEPAAAALGALGGAAHRRRDIAHPRAKAARRLLEPLGRTAHRLGQFLRLTAQHLAGAARPRLGAFGRGGERVDLRGKPRRRVGKRAGAPAEAADHPDEGERHGDAEHRHGDLVGQHRGQYVPADLRLDVNGANDEPDRRQYRPGQKGPPHFTQRRPAPFAKGTDGESPIS